MHITIPSNIVVPSKFSMLIIHHALLLVQQIPINLIVFYFSHFLLVTVISYVTQSVTLPQYYQLVSKYSILHTLNYCKPHSRFAFTLFSLLRYLNLQLVELSLIFCVFSVSHHLGGYITIFPWLKTFI